MKIHKEESIQNYHNFFVELHLLTKDRYTKVSFVDLMRKHRVGYRLPMFLDAQSIIKRVGKNTFWIGKEPDREFSKSLRLQYLSACSEYNQTIRNNASETPKETQTALSFDTPPHEPAQALQNNKEVKVEANNVVVHPPRTFSFLWGMIKFNY